MVVEHIMVAPGGIKETINRINESLAGWLIPPGAQGIQSGTPGKPGGTRLWGTISPHGYLFKAHTHIRGLQCKKGKKTTHTKRIPPWAPGSKVPPTLLPVKQWLPGRMVPTWDTPGDPPGGEKNDKW